MTPDPPRAPAPDRSFLDAAVTEADAVGFVAVGGRFDADLRYLTRFEGPEREYAYVRTPAGSDTGTRDVLCAPRGFAGRAARQFDGRVATGRAADPAGQRAGAVLDAAVGGADGCDSAAADTAGDDAADADTAGDDAADAPTILVPPTIPHDAALYLENAGYDLRSTTAVGDARATKTSEEIEAIHAVQRAAEAGARRAERVLAAAEPARAPADDAAGGTTPGLRWQNAPLTAERLRREVDAELAARGVRNAGNTVVVAGGRGSTCRPRDANRSRDAPEGDSAPESGQIRAGDPIRVDVAPRGPHGYHGALSRTVVVDGDGGWVRRAYVAVEAALDAALGAIESGVTPAAVAREARAELAAFGFDSGVGGASDGSDGADADAAADDRVAAGAHDVPDAVFHGVGLSPREPPLAHTRSDSTLRGSDAALRAGAVVAVAPSVADPAAGSVRLGELVAVTDAGYERLGADSRSYAPRE
ncbi:M24 family metallopeptidase [Halobellus sp. GM3]|uniref:M24 family metallopeptidase n=1 Tax=Halobellus sp. GM3 TaxID=3458410 RepID=UPI00403E0185